MIKISVLCSCLAVILTLGRVDAQGANTRLIGKVFTQADTLVLVETHKDFRYNGYLIPVLPDSTFAFELRRAGAVTAYELMILNEVRSGGWKPARFFNDSDTISFKLYGLEENGEDVIRGSHLVDKRDRYQAARYQKFYRAFEGAYQKLDKAERDEERATGLARIDSLEKEMTAWQHGYLSSEPDLLGLSEHLTQLKKVHPDSSLHHLADYHKFWMGVFPDHPLAVYANGLFERNFGVGNPYVNFSIAHADHAMELATVVGANRFVLLDLWSPWCGPCIRKSRKVEEAYDTLKQHGLAVVSVCGGVKNDAAFDNAVKKFAYPWAVYPEISDENDIWALYGVSYSGGAQFLIDRSGVIVAKDPSVDEIIRLIGQED